MARWASEVRKDSPTTVSSDDWLILTDDGSGSLDSCEPLVFDKSGNLWVANNNDPVPGDGSVVEFTPGQLAQSGSPKPKVVLTETTVSNTSAPSFDDPAGIAFDTAGNLWVGNVASDTSSSVAKFSEQSIRSTGSPQPSVFIDGNAMATNLNEVFFLIFGPKVP